MWSLGQDGGRSKKDLRPEAGCHVWYMAEIIYLDQTVTVSGTTYEHVLVTRDWNPLDEDGVVENKYYAPGVGVIMETVEIGDTEIVELIEYTPA